MPNDQELNTQNLSTQEEAFNTPPSASESPYPPDDAGAYGVIKCYFYTPKRGDIWGAFCFLFNGTTGESMENVFWVTRSLVGPSIDVSTQWRSLNKLIPQMGTYEKSLGDKLSILMLETFSSGVRVELCRNDNPSEQLQIISGEIRNGFERATHCFLEFKIAFERMTKQELTSAGVLTKGSGPAEPEIGKVKSDEKSFAGTLINCLPVIDPVYGKPVSELNPDDMVEVKLQGGVGAGDMIYKYLASTNQEAIFPVESVEKSDSDKTYIFLKINEELKGLITVTKDLRLRVLDVNGPKKTSLTINIDNVIFFGILGVVVVVIALVVKFLLF